MKENKLFTEASLVDSLIYQSLNTNAQIINTIGKAINDSIIIDSSYIQEQIIQINRTKISPLADEVLKAFTSGTIVLLYANIVKVPQAIPFFVTKIQGQLKVFIFVNNYGTIAKSSTSNEKFLNMSMKDLYVLMEGAYTAYKYALTPISVTKNLGLMKLCSSLYVSMINKILNKEYALSMDPDVFAKVSFCFGKFFIERIWMYTNKDVAFSYAIGNINTVINKSDFLILDDMYNAKNIVSFNDLLAFIRDLSPRVKDINFRYFLQCYINTFKPGAMFSLEVLPYFLYVIEASMIGSFLVNQPIISDVIKNTKGMNQFYPELVKSIG